MKPSCRRFQRPVARHLLSAQPTLQPTELARSIWALVSMGLLGASPAAWAQGAGGTLAAGTVPVLRSVVSNGRDSAGNFTYPATVRAPVALGTAGDRSLTIDQTAQRAIIDWQSFNIAGGSEVTFLHPSASAATLNRIYGGSPSVIQGRMRSLLKDPATGQAGTATGGQLILINQNGILFDRGAQVNAGALVASTLNLSNERFLSGVLQSSTEAAFEGGYDDNGVTQPLRPNGLRTGNIGIGSFGPAQAAAPVLQAGNGGSVMLFAPRIDNDAGIISAPDGQVVLAAGKKVYLSLNPNTEDITLRGYVVEIEAEKEGAGLNLTNLVRNAGEISADRGNVTLAALAVNQEGRVSAKTAVQYNGSIYLKARTKDNESGSVTLAAKSVTEVVPDAADTARVADNQAYDLFRGAINISGRTITSHGTVRAPGGNINLAATDEADATGARVYLGEGSVTTVAGAWADVPLEKNLATFRVTSNELKNAPDQKTGILRGATVTVDLRQSNAILALNGYRDIVQRSVVEKAATGGQLQIFSSGSVIQRPSALLDASGGGYRYGSGWANTSKLLSDDGRIYDLATAPQQRVYTALLDRYEKVDARWGQTVSLANPLGSVGTFYESYIEGKSGGLLAVNAGAGLVLDGELRGGVTIGTRQLAAAPRGASLRLGEFLPAEAQFAEGQRIGNVVWQQKAADSLGSAFTATSALTPTQIDRVNLAASQVFGPASQGPDGRTETSFGSVEINANGRIELPATVTLTADAGAQVLLRAPQIDLAGDITLPAGSLLVQPFLPAVVVNDSLNTTTDRVFVRAGSTLSVAGQWINQSNADGSAVGAWLPTARVGLDQVTAASTTQGGSITIGSSTIGFAQLARGATLDAGGGAFMGSNQRVVGGNGGRISVANNPLSPPSPDWLQADLKGYATGTGAELTLSMARAVIEAEGANGTLPSNTTRLAPSLWADHGFSRVSVSTTEGIDVVAGVALKPAQLNRVFDPAAAAALASGGDLSAVSTIERLPDAQRLPASLSLSTTGTELATLQMGKGASITADPRASVTLRGAAGLTLAGQISAPGGSVTLTLSGSRDAPPPELRLTRDARISTAGTFVVTPSDTGRVQGTLIDGGTVTLDAVQTGLRTDAGSVIDVSGTSRVVDVNQLGATVSLAQQTLAGHAGTVVIKSQGTTTLDGELRARSGSAAGADYAAGGSFALELRAPEGRAARPLDRRIVIGTGAAGTATDTVDAVLDTTRLQAAGFEKLRLLSENQIEFRGNSVLDFDRGIRLDAPLFSLGSGAQVTLKSTTVALGQSLDPRVFVSGTGVWSLNPGGAPPVLQPSAGSGVLTVDAGTLDLYGSSTISGAALTVLKSQADVRLNGSNAQPELGSLRASGSVQFQATQVYPSTRTAFAVEALGDLAPGPNGSYILMQGNSAQPGDVYAAAGSVRLKADTIVQSGRLLAPHGQIDLQAAELLELGAGSLTSVAGGGLTVPYGRTVAGVRWTYSGVPVESVSATGKRISLSAPTVVTAGRSVVDIAGGGDVLATEFVPGNGGDADITAQANTFAIIPNARLAAAPVDRDIAAVRDLGFGFLSANQDASLYDSITLGAGGPVAAGQYTLLPARYALLPGAYLVQLQTGSAYRNLQPGQTAALANGTVVVEGHRSLRGTSVREGASVGVVVREGSVTRTISDYTLSSAAFLADLASDDRRATPRAPWDAGKLAINNANVLTLGGSIRSTIGAAPAGNTSRTAEIDISGPRIAVTDRVGTDASLAGYLQLESAALSGLGASVLLGGVRSDAEGGIRVTTSASDVVVANSAAAPVKLPELLLSATNSIELRSGSVLGTDDSSAGKQAVTIAAETAGALVRLSNAGQATMDRGTGSAGASSASGVVRIEPGAQLSAGRSLLVDATQSTESRGELRVGGNGGAGGSLAFSSTQVHLGEVEAAVAPLSGLVLSNTDLSAYASLDNFVLRAYAGIDLHGAAQVGSSSLGNLQLDTPVIRAVATSGPAQAFITGQQVTLRSSSTAPAPTAAATGNSLQFSGARIVLDFGSKSIVGFGDVAMQAQDTLTGAGVGSLAVAGNWLVRAPVVQAAAGAQQSWVAAGAGGTGYSPLTLEAGASAAQPAAGNVPLGGRLKLEASQIQVATEMRARSGALELNAQGSGALGGVQLLPGAVLDTRGAIKDFNGTAAVADAGSVTLNARGADVKLAAGAKIEVSAGAAGADAGRLQVNAQGLELAGSLSGQGQQALGGSASLDLGSVSSFADLNAALNTGGFAQERNIRLRTGDIRVLAGDADAVAAQRVSLVADTGRIDVAGTVGTGAAGGAARVELNAATGVALEAGSRVLARATDVGARGGEVRIATLAGSLDMDAAATIDVRAGDRGQAGSVVFGVARDSSNNVGATRLDGTVLRYSDAGLAARLAGTASTSDAPATVRVEATRSYNRAGGSITAADITGYATDHRNFIATAPTRTASLRDETGAVTDGQVVGGTEVRSTGDLSLAAVWDLTTSNWLSGARPGTLTLRAAGDLSISSALGMPNDNIIAGETWNLRLVAGADLASAQPQATLAGSASLAAGKGNLLLRGAAAKVRTGTGDIDLAAAANIQVDNVAAAVYTAGQINPATITTYGIVETRFNSAGEITRVSEVSVFENLNGNRWAINGGGISMRAGGNIVGASYAATPSVAQGDLMVSEWLRRPSMTAGTTVSRYEQLQLTDWWVYRPRFQQAVGTLAGGDIDIAAAGDIRNLSAMLPTTARTTTSGGLQRVVDVQGGGDLRLRAGGNLSGGTYLLGRGIGRFDAGGDVGSERATQFFLGGYGAAGLPAKAALEVSAGRRIELQSVNDPLGIAQNANTAADRIFIGSATLALSGGQAPSPSSYTANGSVSLSAKSDDIAYRFNLASSTRLQNGSPIPNPPSGSGIFPASLSMVAFEGNIVAPTDVATVFLFPSASSQVRLLAGDSFSGYIGLRVSDRDPSTLPSATNLTQTFPGRLNANTGLDDRNFSADQARITERSTPVGEIAFEAQALTGSIPQMAVYFPAASRILAAQDILSLSATLQNLKSTDTTLIRAADGDIRRLGALEIRGGGRLLMQAGRNVDLATASVLVNSVDVGGVVATGSTANPKLPTTDSARVTVLAGVKGEPQLAAMDAAYDELIAMNTASATIVDLYRLLGTETSETVLGATSVAQLASRDPSYRNLTVLDTSAPRALAAYQTALRAESTPTAQTVPLGTGADAQAAVQLYRQLNALSDSAAILAAGSVAQLAASKPTAGLAAFADLDRRFPRVFADYKQRRSRGALPTGVTPIVFSDALAEVVAQVVPAAQVSGGSISSYQTSVQTQGGSSIDLWAPGGDIVVGLTTSQDKTVGILTGAGGAVRSVLSGDFNINQGKVITAQGGDILLYSAAGSIDAGRGAKTSQVTAPPRLEGGRLVFPASATGSGIQTLSSDPDGVGPLVASKPGNVYLFAPAGTIDAGEAGIRSSGNIVLNAQTVLNASNISSSGSAVGVPQLQVGSLASALASGGAAPASAKAAEDTAKAASDAAKKAAAAPPPPKPTILSVEVLGFGDKNCKEDDKECFAK